MRLAQDRRGRVPFALVGVVLLVGSAGLSASLAGGPTPRTDDSVGVAVERATAATNSALRGAVADAGREAARSPVTVPANSTAGRALNDSTPFRDALRIRIYLAAREALSEVRVRSGGDESEAVRAAVSLPAIRNASDLRAAKRRVEIAPAGGGERAENAGLRVRIRNVTVTATRGGRVVERQRLAPEVVVTTPALALHERTERFESRLNRGPLAPGLGRRLTARLYAVAWARGYAQYGGAPVENVLANRHVELAANGALLREQRAAFGRSDPRARRAVAWATARVGATDLLTAANARRGSARTDQLLAAAKDYQKRNPMPGGATSRNLSEQSRAGRKTFRAGVNRTADRAFADLVTGANGTDLAGVLRSAYAAEARLVAAVREVESETRPDPESPGANWTLRSTAVRTKTAVKSADDGAGGLSLGTPAGWHLLDGESRRVVQTHALVAEWVRKRASGGNETTGGDDGNRGNDTRRTVRRWTEAFAVRVGVAGDHRARAGIAPSRPISGVHERGGALDGPNFRNLNRRATEQLVESRGGFDAIARRAVAGTLDARPERVAGRRPTSLRRWVYRDLATLRERVRNLSVTVARNRAVGGSPPTAELARAVRRRRADLLDAPARYDGVADRARVAARAAYLDRILARLDARAEREARTRRGLDGALADAGVSLDRARKILRARTTPEAPPPRPLPADGPGRALNLSVAGAPPYLTLAGLDREQVAAIPKGEKRHPLSARNTNVFAVPYGDAAESVAAAVVGDGGSGETDLRTAALALRAANRTLSEAGNETLAEAGNGSIDGDSNRRLAGRRDALRRSLAASMRDVRRELVAGMALSRFDVTERERRAAIRAGLARWNTTAGRALAVANGSAGRAIAAALVRGRPALRRPDRRDWVRLRAELAVESVRETVSGPPRETVNQTASVTRRVARTALKQAVVTGLGNATELASKRWFGEVLGAVPAGLPVAPVPGYWYATLNVWSVEVRGEYARFAVSAPQGPPGETVVYVREEKSVRVDWDGDGDRELLGRTTPVGFETETVVVVVVPPGPPGVGDRGGNRDETSTGWS
ncbi:hypothetical protein M0R88_12510 [Halorussus gelatinilyticus]|uniref:Uncharacterized protein n=1 Tax=Halorussus gelatinilyticus TaxID=2937524 RepID=A0A8U0IGD7_9EURY|nr:hypothetical protein [Halorussus gelatinilyticus]UPV99343.1 hypothetical protein M0R88_12510 [Halorussus gelatinilyticus]